MIMLIIRIVLLYIIYIYSKWTKNAPFDSRFVKLCDIGHYLVSIHYPHCNITKDIDVF